MNPNDETIKVHNLRKYDIKVKPSGSTVMVASSTREPKRRRSPNNASQQLPKRRCLARQISETSNTSDESMSQAHSTNRHHANDDPLDSNLDNLSFNLSALSPGAVDEINAEMLNMADLPANVFDSVINQS